MKKASLVSSVMLLLATNTIAQQDTLKIKKEADSPAAGASSVITSNLGPAVIDSNDDNNFLEMYYYGPDMDGTYDIYDPWDIYPDRDEDTQDRDRDDRDGQQPDTRE